jgi:hypothetical protein
MPSGKVWLVAVRNFAALSPHACADFSTVVQKLRSITSARSIASDDWTCDIFATLRDFTVVLLMQYMGHFVQQHVQGKIRAWKWTPKNGLAPSSSLSQPVRVTAAVFTLAT